MVDRKSITIEINGQDVILDRDDAIAVYTVIRQVYGIYDMMSTAPRTKEDESKITVVSQGKRD